MRSSLEDDADGWLSLPHLNAEVSGCQGGGGSQEPAGGVLAPTEDRESAPWTDMSVQRQHHVAAAVCLLLTALTLPAQTITNSQQLPTYSQFQKYPEELNRAALSPQEQSHILSDVQQHRFHVNQNPRQPTYQPQLRPPAAQAFPTQQLSNFQQPDYNFQQPTYQTNYQPQQTYQEQQNSYQPQNTFQASNFPYQVERKPVLLQATFANEQQKPAQTPVLPSPPAQSNNYRQPAYRPQESSVDNYQQQFENYVVPDRSNNYFTEVEAPKDLASYTPEPLKHETPSWILETQPPTPYKKQKPFDAITFGTESYKSTTSAPKVSKYRIKAKTEDTQHKERTTEIYIKPDRKKLYDQLFTISSQTTAQPRVTTPQPTLSPATPGKSDEEMIQAELQKQIQEQLSGKDDIFKTLKITLPGSLSSDQIANLPNLALGDKLEQYEYPTFYQGDGQNMKATSIKSNTKPSHQVKTVVIREPTTTVKPPELLFEELTKNVLPPGADYEVIRQKQDGALEEVGKLKDLQQKKVTFVILEEQPDGSVKVQGVRGNENGPTETKGSEVESIIEKIQKGEIKLPPSVNSKRAPNSTPQESVSSPSFVKHTDKSEAPNKRLYPNKPTTASHSVNSHGGPYKEDKREPSRSRPKYSSPTRSTFLPTVSPTKSEKSGPVYSVTTERSILGLHQQTSPAHYDRSASIQYHSSTQAPTTFRPVAASPSTYQTSPSPHNYQTVGPSIWGNTLSPTAYFPSSPTHYSPSSPTPQYTFTERPYKVEPQTSVSEVYSTPQNFASQNSVLGEVLKKNGFYAMAKFLKQSGLETVLNETGPYTMFIPSDRAFRSLLVQLGGPDRAELKFKENPRLLSGLLLHHVIPGSFKVDSLQDEMTGVSLAGTQLRVNTYATQDSEWNNVKTTTINGARVVTEKADLEVPQGRAHGVDRVMFPLPVGDIVQTLQADREARFTPFLRLLKETGVQSMLTGSKSYTVFAPTSTALPELEVDKLLENRASARALALRHIAPGTLYSAGMLFYQLRDSMAGPNQIQLSKDNGRVKANKAHVVSRNIPATNGVIHAIDSLL